MQCSAPSGAASCEPPRGPQLSADDYPTAAALADAWARVEAHMRASSTRPVTTISVGSSSSSSRAAAKAHHVGRRAAAARREPRWCTIAARSRSSSSSWATRQATSTCSSTTRRSGARLETDDEPGANGLIGAEHDPQAPHGVVHVRGQIDVLVDRLQQETPARARTARRRRVGGREPSSAVRLRPAATRRRDARGSGSSAVCALMSSERDRLPAGRVTIETDPSGR
mgnify:CR=1 FL=1